MKRTAYENIQSHLKNNETVTLQDILDIANPEKDTFAIGANSAFIFMGDVDTFYRDAAYLERYYEPLYDNFYEKTFNDYCVKKYQAKLFKETKEIQSANLEDIPDDFKENIKKSFKEELKKRDIPERFTCYLERPVRNFYIKKLEGEPKFAVILQGVESGKCWLLKEYPKALHDIKHMIFRTNKYSSFNQILSKYNKYNHTQEEN